jgi:hypothetical protein
MHTLRRAKRVALFLALLLVISAAVPATSIAAEPTVNLGTSAPFAVLAHSTITNTGATTITGDVGLHPGTDVTGWGTVTLTGAMHITDAVALLATTDLETAYSDAAGRPVSATLTSELGGLTVLPGVYDATEGGSFSITGTLTLDAQGDPEAVFIFKSGATLITQSASHVELINGARFCRVFWVVPSSATLGTNSTFAGHIFAYADITATTGAIIEGQLLARTGQVALQGNTITNTPCGYTRAIHITKSANPTALPVGGGPVTYTYLVTNTGSGVLGDIHVADDKISLLTYVSGDDGDGLLETGETWRYTATADLTASTVNIASVTASDNIQAVAATDTAAVTVTVGRSTATGDRLPNTATPWYNVLLVGVALTLLGAAGWWTATRKSRA